MENKLLEVKNLTLVYRENEQQYKILDDISFSINEKEIFGLVGESGCGKSMTAMVILQLLTSSQIKVVSGEIIFNGRNLLLLSEREMRKIRSNQIAIIFQDPMSSLNPVYSVGEQITETILEHNKISKKKAWDRASYLLDVVGIPDPKKSTYKYPHELSGGMRQRVMIAMALSCNPKLLIADEPTTALDVTVQHQIINLLLDLKKKFNMSVILITHDLGLVSETANRIGVMYAGNIVEVANVKEMFASPFHPYTQGLIECIPKINANLKELKTIPGQVPTLQNRKQGCLFYSRCSFREDRCKTDKPILDKIKEKDHQAACWLYH